MNDVTLIGPCTDYEHDLVDLIEGALGPERTRVVRLHLQACARCRAWEAEYRAFDARLAEVMPRVALSDDFEQRLGERLAALAAPVRRADPTLAAVREHERLLAALGRGARRHALLDAIGSAAVTFCVLVLLNHLFAQSGLLPMLLEGSGGTLLLGALGSVVALVALGWSVLRGRPLLRNELG